MSLNSYQHTVTSPVHCSGVGMHSGRAVHLTVRPAPVNHGIRFIRTDLPDSPSVSAHFNMVVDTSLATVIGYDGFIISTIEHLMSALAGLAIDNAVVEVDGPEMPIMDGSALPFAKAILAAGLEEQSAPRYYFAVKDPIEINESGKSIAIYPADTFKITYTIEYAHPLIQRMSYAYHLAATDYTREISAARTFGFYHEYEYLKRYGFARGGSLDNVVVLNEEGILNEDGLRYPNEFVRHKILDSIGDLYLLGMPILGHVVAEKAGHAMNNAILKKIFSLKNAWQTTQLDGTFRQNADVLAV